VPYDCGVALVRDPQALRGPTVGVGFEVLNDVVLKQVLVAFGDDACSRGVIEAVQADGTCLHRYGLARAGRHAHQRFPARRDRTRRRRQSYGDHPHRECPESERPQC
jgi:hypothetical protein